MRPFKMGDGDFEYYFTKNDKRYKMKGSIKDAKIHIIPDTPAPYICFNCKNYEIEKLLDLGCQVFYPKRSFFEFSQNENGKFSRVELIDE